ncbi:MAG TPA: prenyltransferase/squalene oxidase repeat-containing protein [Solirubrobacterales bacterium]|jgi:hypothetical protein|nr:prenyltransferase/squalene oxidase repeat-containing protein [Solirubrobacterales bacterium]
MTASADGGSPLIVDEAARWNEALQARTVALPDKRLDRAVKFLESAQHSNVWGLYPGAALDRHSSAMAVAALRTATDAWLIGNSTAFFLEKYRAQVNGLGVDPLIDVIELIKDALPHEQELRKQLSKRAKQHIRRLVSDERMGTTARLAALIATAWSAGLIDRGDAETGWQRLISTQNGDGSWSAVRGNRGTLTATATALMALSHASLDGGLGVQHDAFNFLASQIRDIEKAEEVPDVFVVSITLLAIAGYERCDYWLIAQLEDALLEQQNDDGGWPEHPESPSTVEHTALAVLALTAAGARSHVPTRLARAALEQARGQIGDLGEQRDLLQSEFDKAVQERCGGLLTENVRLKEDLLRTTETASQVSGLEERLAQLRRVAEPVAYGSELLAETPLRSREYVVVAVAISVVTSAVLVTGLIVGGLVRLAVPTVATSLIGVLVAAGALSVALQAWRSRERRYMRAMNTFAERSHSQWLPVDIGPVDERLRALRITFSRILDECAPPVREELVYLLFERFIDIPADVAARLAEQMGSRLGMSADGVLQFRRWASAAALLEPSERQVLFDQIRRSVQL